jgi:DNA polymerase-1
MSIMDSYQAHTTPAHEFLIDLELNGIEYDVDLNTRMKKKMEIHIAELEGQITDKIKTEFNFDSGAETAQYLYGTLGIEPRAFTKTKEPSTDGDALKELAKELPEHSEWLKLLVVRNDIASAYRTFVRSYVDDFVKPDGRVHPNYNQHGTSSFRISGSDPNLTQLPRPKHGYNIRQMFKVKDGMVFMAFDFSSAEVKILGALCKDPSIARAIREGLDFHAFSASSMFGVEYEIFMAVLGNPSHHLYKEYKENRQISKVLTFSILYGSSPGGIAMQLGVTLDRARELIDMYFNLFPGIKTYVECSHKMAITNNYIVGPFGQRKQGYGAKEIFKGTAVYNGTLRNFQNVWTQGTTSSFGLACFTRVNEAIKPYGAFSICTVFDSLEIECPIEHAATVFELAFYHLNDEPVSIYDWLDLPVGVDGEIGYNWGDAVHLHRGATQEEILGILGSMNREVVV